MGSGEWGVGKYVIPQSRCSEEPCNRANERHILGTDREREERGSIARGGRVKREDTGDFRSLVQGALYQPTFPKCGVKRGKAWQEGRDFRRER